MEHRFQHKESERKERRGKIILDDLFSDYKNPSSCNSICCHGEGFIFLSSQQNLLDVIELVQCLYRSEIVHIQPEYFITYLRQYRIIELEETELHTILRLIDVLSSGSCVVKCWSQSPGAEIIFVRMLSCLPANLISSYERLTTTGIVIIFVSILSGMLLHVIREPAKMLIITTISKKLVPQRG